eukprot:UN09851
MTDRHFRRLCQQYFDVPALSCLFYLFFLFSRHRHQTILFHPNQKLSLGN